MFYIDSDTQLTLNDIKKYIDAFKASELPRLKKLDNYYRNNNDRIKTRSFEDLTQPNNKIAHSFAHYITTINTALFVSSPVTYKSADNIEDYQTVLDAANEQNINIDLAKDASKFGYAIQLLYLNNQTDIKMTTLNPLNTVLILSDSIESELLYAIRFWTREDINNVSHDYIQVYNKDLSLTYKDDILIDNQNNVFTDIPVVIYKNNEDLIGDYELVMPLIDAYDILESDSANESDYFNNCYFYLNMPIPTTEEEIKQLQDMKQRRTLTGENLNPSFITKPVLENDIEKDRIVSDIHKLSYTPDMSDNNFANNISGEAMKYKLLGTLFNASNKQRKFKEAINNRNRILFDIMTYKMFKVPSYVETIFTVNIPKNTLETAQMINQLRGLVSDKTLIAQLPFIDDPENEIDELNSQQTINTFEEEE